MRQFTQLALLFSVIAGLCACAKDHDLDDYKSEQFQKEYAKVAVVNSRYSGVLKSARTGHAITALQIVLRATADTVTSGDQSGDSLKPIVSAQVIFAGGSERVPAVIPKGQFDTQNHVFHGNIQTSSDQSNPGVVLDLTGVINSDGTFNGTLAADGYEDEGGTFEVSKNGASVEQLVSENDLGRGSIFSSTSNAVSVAYAGTYTDKPGAGGTFPAQMTVSALSRNRLQQLGDLLVPSVEKSLAVSFTVNRGSGFNIPTSFPTATYDVEQGTLISSVTQSISSGGLSATLGLNCQRFLFNRPNANFTCIYTNTVLGHDGTLQMHSL